MNEQNKPYGVLWKKLAKSGSDFYSGNVNGVEVVAFNVTNKEKDTQPDLNVLIKKTKEELEQKAQNPQIKKIKSYSRYSRSNISTQEDNRSCSFFYKKVR